MCELQLNLPQIEPMHSEIHFSLHSPDEKNTELKKILTEIHLFLLDLFYSNIETSSEWLETHLKQVFDDYGI